MTSVYFDELPLEPTQNCDGENISAEGTSVELTEDALSFLIEQAEFVAHADDADDADDENYTEEFKPAPHVHGEILLPIGAICEWEHHLRRHSPATAEHAAALALTAADPAAFRPIDVLEKDGLYYVIDGRFILAAIRDAHRDDDDVMVRAMVFQGSEEEAVAKMCDAAIGTSVVTKMETAHGLLSLQRVGRLSQVALAERYAGLSKDRVSRMLMAARLQEDFPLLFHILKAPHMAPIRYGVEISQAMKTMSDERVHAMLDIAKEALEEGLRFSAGDAQAFLDVQPQGAINPAARANPSPKRIDALESEPILGHDDQPVAARERLKDNIERIRLPDTSTMKQMEREAAADAIIAEIRRYFGLN